MELKIERLTIAVTEMDDMVDFYNQLFGSQLRPMPMGALIFFRGDFLGTKLLFCPADVAGVVANENRHQFRIRVKDIHKFLEQVNSYGGKVIDQVQEQDGVKIAGFADPDGNTFELIQLD